MAKTAGTQERPPVKRAVGPVVVDDESVAVEGALADVALEVVGVEKLVERIDGALNDRAVALDADGGARLALALVAEVRVRHELS
jgi:hypothetical protein